MLCHYGCNQEAIYELKNKKWCCSDHFNKCPELKRKNSEGVKLAHKEERCTHKHFDLKNARDWSKGKNAYNDNRLGRKYTNEQIFSENSTLSTGYVKKILLSIENITICSMCGNSEWLGKPIALELDHINGKNTDHRKENLRLICPNCHSTTETWKGRNKNGQMKVSDEELLEAIKTSPNIRQALRKVGLSAMGKNYTRAYELKSTLDKDQVTIKS